MFARRDPWWSTQRHSLDQSRGNCSQPRLELLEDRTLLNAGDLDPAFGTAGKLVTDFSGPIPASADAAVIQPDGKIVVAGTGTSHGPSFPPTPNNRDLLLARYNSDGTLDTGFGNSGQVNTPFFGAGQYVADNHQVKGLAIAPDGKIVVVGQHLDNSFNFVFVVARYAANGSLDPTFGSGGTVATVPGTPIGVFVQADGRIVVVGNSNQQPLKPIVVRYNTGGQLDPSFGTGGQLMPALAFISSAVLQLDGRLVVVSGTTVARFNPDGSPDTGFGAGGQSTVNYGLTGVVLQSDGKLVVVGMTNVQYPNTPVPKIARFTPNGRLDTSFGNNGLIVAPFGAISIALGPDGKIVIVGHATPLQYAVARFNADGCPDATFGAGGTSAVTVVPAAVVVQGDSKVVVVGADSMGFQGFTLVRFNPDGTGDTGFGTGGKVNSVFIDTLDSSGSHVVVQPDGKIIVVANIGGSLVLIRYNPNGSPDNTFGMGGRVNNPGLGSINLAIGTDGKIVAVGNGAQGGTVVRLNSDGTLDASFGRAGIVTGFTDILGFFINVAPLIQPDGKILVLGSTLARFNPDGSLDTSFGNQGKVVVNGDRMALQPDGKILVTGGFVLNGNLVVNDQVQLTRYTPNGSLDASFGMGSGFVNISFGGSDVTVQPDGKIVIGPPLARLNPDGSLDAFFGNNGHAAVSRPFGVASGKLAIAPNGEIIVGGIEAFRPNGALNVRFGNAGLITPDFTTAEFALHPDGNIVFVGSTAAVGHTSLTVTRYLITGGTSFTANQLFIGQVYADLLYRPVDSSGLASWSTQLDRGFSRTQVVQQIQSSQEYHVALVHDLDHRVFGRFPDDSGDATWSAFLSRGGTVEQLEAIFLGSDEYFSRFASGSSTGFLQGVYQFVLHRPIDSGGLQTWGQALAAGISRAAVAAAILASPESDRLETQSLYAGLLHRPADAGGLDTFSNLLQRGLPNETAIATIVGSDEYFAQV